MTDQPDPDLAALAALVGRIAPLLQSAADPAARAAVVGSVDDLRALVARSPRAGGALGGDAAQIGEALALLAAWLREPTPEREVRAERAMSDLQAVIGPRLGWDPARLDTERRAAYRRQARAALDEIFPDKPKR